LSVRNKTVMGPDEIANDFFRLAAEYPKEALQTLVEVVDLDIGPETQWEVPVDTGALQRSWTGAEIGKGAVHHERKGYIAIDFGYGMNYAIFVHEIPPGPPKTKVRKGTGKKRKYTRRRKKKKKVMTTAYHRPPTKWKYLEDPVFRHIDDPPMRLRVKVDKILTGGG